LFEYALCGRAILTSKLSGAETVLGPQAAYFDPQNFKANLEAGLRELAALPRTELNRRGLAIQHRVLTEFAWEKQAERMAQFIERLCCGKASFQPLREALAA
jgi:glycosyltransferase involved in cell wall biosynthesis